MTFGATPPPSPRPPTRSRASRFVPLGVAAWMVLEIWLLIVVAGATNGLTVFLLLLGGVIAGGYVIKRAGRRAWQNLTGTLQNAGGPTAAKAPAPASGGNTVPMIGGLLLMLPGLISDVLGLLCLLPPVGRLIGRRAEKLLTRRAPYAPGSLGDAFQQARGDMSGRRSGHRPDGKIVQGEVIRDDEPPQAERRGRHPHGTPREDRQDPPLTR